MIDGAAAAILSHVSLLQRYMLPVPCTNPFLLQLERRGLVGRIVVSVLGEEPGGRLGLEAVLGFTPVLLTGGESALLPVTEAQSKKIADAVPAAVKAYNAQLSLLKTSIFL